jgi:hypothetical protein
MTGGLNSDLLLRDSTSISFTLLFHLSFTCVHTIPREAMIIVETDRIILPKTRVAVPQTRAH